MPIRIDVFMTAYHNEHTHLIVNLMIHIVVCTDNKPPVLPICSDTVL